MKVLETVLNFFLTLAQGHFRFPLPEGEEGQEEEAGEEDKDGRWETVYACGER